MKIQLVSAIAGLAIGLTAFAKPPVTNPDLPGGGVVLPPVMKLLSGSVLVTNCQVIQPSDVIVRLSNGKSVATRSKTLLTDGRVRLDYSFAFTEAADVNLTVTPAIRSTSRCAGNSFSPSSRQVTRVPVASVNFSYIKSGQSHSMSRRDFAATVDLAMRLIKLKLNNQGSQSSFVELKGSQIGFEIPRVTVDLDCGTLCPDVGDGHFYINDVNLESASFDVVGAAFQLALRFEDSGREIKGYHSVLGDNGMPDFNMRNILLKLKVLPFVTSNAKLSLNFYDAQLSSSTESTGGCNIAGIDICNAIFGTDRKIEKGVEQAAGSAMNSQLIQAGLQLAMDQLLQSKGINGPVLSAVTAGDYLNLVTP